MANDKDKKQEEAVTVTVDAHAEVTARVTRVAALLEQKSLSAEAASVRLAGFQPRVPISFVVASRRSSREKHL